MQNISNISSKGNSKCTTMYHPPVCWPVPPNVCMKIKQTQSKHKISMYTEIIATSTMCLIQSFTSRLLGKNRPPNQVKDHLLLKRRQTEKLLFQTRVENHPQNHQTLGTPEMRDWKH